MAMEVQAPVSIFFNDSLLFYMMKKTVLLTEHPFVFIFLDNFPLKGGKMSNWDGGIRVNGFVSGGFLPEAQKGTQYEGIVTIWDWYATLSAFAGVDPTDHRAAAASLPAIDSIDHSGVIMGTAKNSPRKVLPIGTEPRPSNLSTAPLCSTYNIETPYYFRADGSDGGNDIVHVSTYVEHDASSRCTTVSGIIIDERSENGGRLWKLLTGDVTQNIYTGPHYPNASTNEFSQHFVQHCANGCLYDLVSDPLEENEVTAQYPDVVKRLRNEILSIETTAFNPDRGTTDPKACEAVFNRYEGFWGPFLP